MKFSQYFLFLSFFISSVSIAKMTTLQDYACRGAALPTAEKLWIYLDQDNVATITDEKPKDALNSKEVSFSTRDELQTGTYKYHFKKEEDEETGEVTRAYNMIVKILKKSEHYVIRYKNMNSYHAQHIDRDELGWSLRDKKQRITIATVSNSPAIFISNCSFASDVSLFFLKHK